MSPLFVRGRSGSLGRAVVDEGDGAAHRNHPSITKLTEQWVRI